MTHHRTVRVNDKETITQMVEIETQTVAFDADPETLIGQGNRLKKKYLRINPHLGSSLSNTESL
jgi:hypothetical protein